MCLFCGLEGQFKKKWEREEVYCGACNRRVSEKQLENGTLNRKLQVELEQMMQQSTEAKQKLEYLGQEHAEFFRQGNKIINDLCRFRDKTRKQLQETLDEIDILKYDILHLSNEKMVPTQFADCETN